MLLSNRALRTENGFKTNPTATRVVAPARRFPWLVKLGRTDPLRPSGYLLIWAKYGERAMNVRNCVKLVIYIATPGTLRASEGNVPRQRPFSPCCAITSRVVVRITEERELGILKDPSPCCRRVLRRSNGWRQTVVARPDKAPESNCWLTLLIRV